MKNGKWKMKSLRDLRVLLLVLRAKRREISERGIK